MSVSLRLAALRAVHVAAALQSELDCVSLAVAVDDQDPAAGLVVADEAGGDTGTFGAPDGDAHVI
jgi:hypothetical protein